ncbi:MAG: hypothetical protein KF855_03675 [Acidobacteria bacterium]|nr:hypothetical protein [Acidobacteriota bacterium]
MNTNENTPWTHRVLMICKNEEASSDVSELLGRVSSSMAAIETFVDGMVQLDEDGPELADKAAPMLERLFLTLINIYPNAGQMTADIGSIGDIAVMSEQNLKKLDEEQRR